MDGRVVRVWDRMSRERGEKRERRVTHLASQHFVEEDAQRPPVNACAVRRLFDDLGRDVVGRSAERRGELLVDVFLAHAKVRNLESK